LRIGFAQSRARNGERLSGYGPPGLSVTPFRLFDLEKFGENSKMFEVCLGVGMTRKFSRHSEARGGGSDPGLANIPCFDDATIGTSLLSAMRIIWGRCNSLFKEPWWPRLSRDRRKMWVRSQFKFRVCAPGVGVLTALAFVLIIGKAERFDCASRLRKVPPVR